MSSVTNAELILETRSTLIRRRTIESIAKSSDNALKFASRVAEKYTSAVPQFQRVTRFYEAGTTLESALSAEGANGKLVDHLLKGVVKFPTDLEECWVDALLEPFRSDLVRELAQRYGLVGAKLADLAPHEHIARLSDVLTDAGRTAQLLAPLFKTGTLDVDSADGQRIVQSMVQINRGIADLISLQEQVKAQLPRARAKPSASVKRHR